MNVNCYLSQFVNCDFGLNNTIDYIITETASDFIQIYTYQSEKYSLSIGIEDIELKRKDFLEDALIINDKYDVQYFFNSNSIIDNAMLIPIKNNRSLGLLCLFNRNGGFKEELLAMMGPILTVLQLMLEKKENVYSGKDLFLANMSHEIRTPLNGIIGYNQLLNQTKLDSTQRNYLKCMNQCSVQLLQIINDILDFAKLSSGKMTVNKECFSLKHIELMVMNAMSQRIEKKKQSITFEYNSECTFFIADKLKIVQILINLISNANKFTDVEGNIDVIFNSEGKTLYIKVKDNGIGITEENLKRIFIAFEQIENRSSTNGSGLGLAICKKLSNLLEGDLQVKSKYGEGSEFIMSVNFEDHEESSKNINTDIFKDKTVLLIDSNEESRMLIVNWLKEWKMNAVLANTALEGLRMILSGKKNFDLAFIDICLPESSGTHLAQQIKAEKPLFPIIALSSIDSFVNTNEFELKLDRPLEKHHIMNSIQRILAMTSVPSSFIGETPKYPIASNCSSEMFNKNVRILIAEDITYNRNLLDNMLQNLGYNHIDVAENGEVAINMINHSHNINKPYETLLLDLRMPVVDGFRVLEIYKEKGWSLPIIIVITASIMDEDLDKCKKMGVNYFLTKPLELKKLKEVMLHVSELL